MSSVSRETEKVLIGQAVHRRMVHSDDVIWFGAVGWQCGTLQWAPETLLLLHRVQYADNWFIQCK